MTPKTMNEQNHSQNEAINSGDRNALNETSINSDSLRGLNKELAEIEKGCGEPKCDYEHTFCGDDRGNLCPECQAKKSQLIKDQKMFEEFVKRIREEVAKDKYSYTYEKMFIDFLYKLTKEMIGEEKGK